MGNTRNRYPGRRRFLKQSAALSAGAASLATPAIVLAKTAPSAAAKPVRILVGAPQGGTADTVARAVATGMAKALGQPVVVENRSGATGHVAAEAVARGAPDGTTLLVSSTSHAIDATLDAQLPFDPIADLTPITMLATAPSLLIGHPSLPANSLAELVALLKRNPGKHDAGIGALGSPLHMAGETLKLDTGTFVVDIPYRASARALQDLVAGQVQLMFVPPAIGGAQLKAGKVRAFGTTAPKRLAQFPEVPAISEVVKGFESHAGVGLFGPARLPADLTQRLYEAARSALAQPDLRQRFDNEALEPVGNSPAEFARSVQKDSQRRQAVVRYAGARTE